MQIEDAFWATRTILRFSDEMIRAIVETGQISDPDASNYLVETLIKRRDKIIRYYLARINPLDEFQLTGRTGPSLRLEFKNLGLEAGLASRSTYQYQWFRFDNQRRSLEPLGQISSSTEPSLVLVQDRAAYLMVRISTLVSEQPDWKKKVEVFIRNDPQNPTIVGLDRES